MKYELLSKSAPSNEKSKTPGLETEGLLMITTFEVEKSELTELSTLILFIVMLEFFPFPVPEWLMLTFPIFSVELITPIEVKVLSVAFVFFPPTRR